MRSYIKENISLADKSYEKIQFKEKIKNIPKKIHYIWFGGDEKPESVLRCIASWKKYMPDYEIIEWNENNFQFDNQYAKEAYERKKYAFVSDYARFKIIYEYGGIYLDTDVEIIKSLEPLLEYGGYMGFERVDTVATGLGFAAPMKSRVIGNMLSIYDELHFIVGGKMDLTACPVRNTEILVKMGMKANNTLQRIDDVIIYPKEYFCPLDYDSGRLLITNNTYTIHHYAYSWSDEESKKRLRLKRAIFKIFPGFCAQQIFDIINHIPVVYKFF